MNETTEQWNCETAERGGGTAELCMIYGTAELCMNYGTIELCMNYGTVALWHCGTATMHVLCGEVGVCEVVCYKYVVFY